MNKKEQIIEFLQENKGTYRANELAKLFGSTQTKVDAMLKDDDRFEVSKYGSVNRYAIKRDTTVILKKSKMQGEYKMDLQTKINLERCKELRPEKEEFHAKTIGGTVAEWTYFPV